MQVKHGRAFSLLILATLLCRAQDVKTTAIRGAVIDAQTHAGIDDAEVRVSGSTGSAAFDTRVRCGPGGVFLIDLPHGDYVFAASAAGYARPKVEDTMVLRVASEQPPGKIELRLDRLAGMRGIVLDGNTEAPLGGVSVLARRTVYLRGRRQLWVESFGSTRTRSDGSFQIDNVPAGDYFLEFSVPPPAKPASEKAGTPQDALQYGRVVWPGPPETSLPMTGISSAESFIGVIKLYKRALPTVRVRVQASPCDESKHYHGLLQQTEGAARLERASFEIGCTGEHTLAAISPGAYEVVVSDVTDGMPSEAGTTHITVDRDDEAAEVIVSQPIQFDGQVLIDGQGPSKDSGTAQKTPKISVQIWPMKEPDDQISAGPTLGYADAGTDGKFAASAFPWSGLKYEVLVSHMPPNMILKRVIYNGAASDDGIFTLNLHAVSQSLAIVLSTKPAVISGSVVTASGNPDANAVVLAIRWPVAAQAYPETLLEAVTDSDGRFSFERLKPGDYRLVSVAKADRAALERPGALVGLAARTDSVTVAEGGSASVALVRLKM